MPDRILANDNSWQAALDSGARPFGK